MTWQTGDLRSCGIVQRYNSPYTSQGERWLSWFMFVNLYQNMPGQASSLLTPVTRNSNHIEFTFRIFTVAEDRKSSNIVAVCKP